MTKDAALESVPCPDCGEPRVWPEALRVHRWLAHGVKELPTPHPKAS